jgi:hypothetical protein
LLCRNSNHPSSEGTFLIPTPRTRTNSSVHPGLVAALRMGISLDA